MLRSLVALGQEFLKSSCFVYALKAKVMSQVPPKEVSPDATVVAVAAPVAAGGLKKIILSPLVAVPEVSPDATVVAVAAPVAVPDGVQPGEVTNVVNDFPPLRQFEMKTRSSQPLIWGDLS